MMIGIVQLVADVYTEHGPIRKHAVNLAELPGIGLMNLDSLKVLSLNANVYRLNSILMLNQKKFLTNVEMLYLTQ